MVRQFGARAAMNTPIQGTAADIMKLAMVNLDKALEETNLDAKIILQVHDELILEVNEKDKEQAKQLLKECMENAVKLTVPLEVEVSEATNWYECKQTIVRGTVALGTVRNRKQNREELQGTNRNNLARLGTALNSGNQRKYYKI